VAIGLRLLSEMDIQAARKVAAETAVRGYTNDDGQVTDHDAFTEAFNDALVHEAIARAICDANDVTKPHPLLPYAHDLVAYAFTSPGARFIWDALHELTTKNSPVVREATDLEVAALAACLNGASLARLSRRAERSVRKLLTAALDELVAAGVAFVVNDDTDANTDANEESEPTE
jgi:predicted naringenin-chalcone synthase